MRVVLAGLTVLLVCAVPSARAQVLEAVPDTLSSSTAGLAILPEEALLSNDSVSEGDSIRLEIVSGPVNGSLERQSDGLLLYVPAVGFVGQDRFVYQWRTVPLQRLTIDPAVSILSFDAELQTDLGPADDSEDIPVEGTVVAHLGDDPASIDSVHVVGVDLTNRGDHSLRFEYGSPISVASLRILVEAGDVGLSLLEPGTASAASGILKTWTQQGNLVDVSVSASLEGGGLFTSIVPDETQQLQTQTTEGLSGSVIVNGQQLLMLLNVASSNTFDLEGNSVALDIAGSLQATGSFVASQVSNEAEVIINVVSGAGRENIALPAVALDVYPNPSSNVFHMRWNGPSGNYRIEVFDALGRLVHDQDVGASPGSDEMRSTLDASNWPAGVYFARIHSDQIQGAAFTRTHMIVRQ